MIYVLSKNGHPLMPTSRERHVKFLLDTGKARIAAHVPFTIQLLVGSPENVQPLVMGIDPGRTNIGNAVIDLTGKLMFSAVCETRNKAIRKLMEKRKICRMASRRGERKARQRLAKKFNTMFAAGQKMRRLPQCKEGITCNGIINTEARFCNRKRSKGWLTPTVSQLVETHVNLYKKLCRFIPVTDVAIEVNRFAFALMDDPSISGIDFQNGALKGFDDIEQAVFEQQHGKCLMCGSAIQQYHHIVPKSKGGSENLKNRVGLCDSCHTKVHTDSKFAAGLSKVKTGLMKKYGALSALNQAIPFICKKFIGLLGEDHVAFTTGYTTADMRNSLGYVKTTDEQLHDIDAYIIASSAVNIHPEYIDSKPYQIQQFRRHDRAIISCQNERTYKLNGETIAKNRKPRFEQTGDSFADWYNKSIENVGKQFTDKLCGQITVSRSHRRYNNLQRLLPGAEFMYQGQRFIMSGQLSNGACLRAVGDSKTNYPAKQCIIEKRNQGLVFVA